MPSKKTNLHLTTRGRYAVIAMAELAEREGQEPVPLADIAKSGKISLSYLEQLFAGLRRNGLVKSYKGPGGGYVLAKSPQDIRISDILRSAEDSVPAKRATGNKQKISKNSKTVDLWDKIGEVLFLFTDKLSLADVINEDIYEHPTYEKLIKTLS